MYPSMTGDDEAAQSGSVVLRLDSSNRKGVVSALRRTLEPNARSSAAREPLTRSFIANAAHAGLGEVLLLQEQQQYYDDGPSSRRQSFSGGGGGGRRAGLGTFLGVFVPCTCTIFGDVVFLRLGFVVGQAGVWCALLIIVAAFVLCLLTTLSLCTLIGEGGDGQPGGATQDPGVYCALRKAVGPELGAALGLTFFLAFTVDAAFYATGFAVMLSDSLPYLRSNVDVFPWNPAGKWVDVLIASCMLLAVTLVCSRGVVFSAKASLLTLVVILLCILSSLLCLLLPTEGPVFTGFNLTTFQNNAGPNLSAFAGSVAEGGSSMMLMFVLVFPGFTGMLAGSNLSGNLRTPTSSIARGSLSSLVFVLGTRPEPPTRARRSRAHDAHTRTRTRTHRRTSIAARRCVAQAPTASSCSASARRSTARPSRRTFSSSTTSRRRCYGCRSATLASASRRSPRRSRASWPPPAPAGPAPAPIRRVPCTPCTTAQAAPWSARQVHARRAARAAGGASRLGVAR